MQRFKNILCVLTQGDTSKTAFKRAVALARNNQAHLSVVEVIDVITPNTRLLERVLAADHLMENRITQHEKQLQQLVAEFQADLNISTKVLAGIPFLETIYEVLNQEHDLLIKTANNGGMLDRLFGSDDMHLLRKCPCPVWLVKPNSPDKYQSVIAAVDVEDFYPERELPTRQKLNVQIVEMASSLAISEFSELHFINAWEVMGEAAIQSNLMNNAKDMVKQYYDEIETHHRNNLKKLVDSSLHHHGDDTMSYLKAEQQLINGKPRDVIPGYADKINADLVVLGTVARTGIPGFFMGNTAETILNRLQCSVLAIKPPGFVTPVSATSVR